MYEDSGTPEEVQTVQWEGEGKSEAASSPYQVHPNEFFTSGLYSRSLTDSSTSGMDVQHNAFLYWDYGNLEVCINAMVLKFFGLN